MDAPAWISAVIAVIAVLTTTIGVVLTSKHEKGANEAAANDVVETGSLKDSRLEKSLLPAGSSIEICGVFDMGSSSIVRVTWNRLPETNDTKSYLWEGTFPPRQG